MHYALTFFKWLCSPPLRPFLVLVSPLRPLTQHDLFAYVQCALKYAGSRSPRWNFVFSHLLDPFDKGGERHFQTDELDVIFHRWSRKVIRYRALSGMGVEVVCQSQGGFPVSRSDAL